MGLKIGEIRRRAMKRKWKALLAVTLILVLFVTGCSGSKTSESNSDAKVTKDSLVVGRTGSLTSLDPQMVGDAGSEAIVGNIFDTLVRQNNEGEIVPNVATEWDVDASGMTYTFKIKKGIKYHNGLEMTAHDVKFTLDRAAEAPMAAELVECVSGVEVIDDYTVKIYMAYSYGPFIVLLGAPQLAIVNEKIVEEYGEGLGRNPVGSGPYKFVEWVAGDRLVLEAFEDYHRGVAPIKNLTIKLVNDTSTGFIALENNELDAFIGLSPVDRENAKKNASLTYYETQALRSSYLSFNTEKEPFNDPLVRQAVAHALDYNAILDISTNGSGALASNHISPMAFGYTDEVQQYERDVEKAKALLAQAGHPNGFSTKIMVSSSSGAKEAQVLQAGLNDIGVTAEIEQYERGTFLDMGIQGEFDILTGGWGYLAADADQGLYAVYHSSQIDSINMARYNNPKLDAYLEIGRKSPDPAERLEAYKKATHLLHDESPTIPFFWQTSNIVANKDLKGVEALPLGFYYFHDFSW